MTNNKTAEWENRLEDKLRDIHRRTITGCWFIELGDAIHVFKELSTDIEQSAYQRGREDLAKELIVKINEIKELVNKETGSFKYDSCYEDCISVIEKTLATDKPG